jgi:hypothetical protein
MKIRIKFKCWRRLGVLEGIDCDVWHWISLKLRRGKESALFWVCSKKHVIVRLTEQLSGWLTNILYGIFSLNFPYTSDEVRGGWEYNSAHSWPRAQMEVSGHPHVPVEGRNHRCQLNRRLVGPQSRSGRFEGQKNILTMPGPELTIVHPVA